MRCPVVALFNVFGDAATWAAERLCQRDHTGERRARAAADALESRCSCPTTECPLLAEDICDEAEAADDADMADSDLFLLAATSVDQLAQCKENVIEADNLFALADQLRDRAAQFAVLEAEHPA